MAKTSIHEILRAIRSACSKLTQDDKKVSFNDIKREVVSNIGISIGNDYLAEKIQASGWHVDRRSDPWFVSRC